MNSPPTPAYLQCLDPRDLLLVLAAELNQELVGKELPGLPGLCDELGGGGHASAGARVGEPGERLHALDHDLREVDGGGWRERL